MKGQEALPLLLAPEPAPARPAVLFLTSKQRAGLYVSVAFLRSVLDFLGEQHWLRTEREKDAGSPAFTYPEFLLPFLEHELSPIPLLHELLGNGSAVNTKALKARAAAIEAVVLECMIEEEFAEQKSFALEALHRMGELFLLETKLQLDNKDRGTHLGLSLYRTFDGLDQLFGLNYALDKNVKQELLEPERLYEGAGVGVQSGCSTVLTLLRHMVLAKGDRFIDLGSGYGRVGLLVGLLRPDLDFTGYEFVKERVGVANAAAENLGMQSHVHFLTQDLAAKEFLIPDAELYYLYDPFSESTYRSVLAQLVEIARRKKVMIVTKGNASFWLDRTAESEGWPAAARYDSGNLCLYSSRV